MAYVEELGILRATNAHLDHFDPEFLERSQAFWSDPRIRARYYVESGSRSFEKQTELYNGFANHLPGYSPANRPGTSEHEYGSDKHPFAKAMDVHPVPGKGGSYDELHRIAAEYGFCFPILAEAWHMQLNPKRKPFAQKIATPNQVAVEVDDMIQIVFGDGAVLQMNSAGQIYCPELPGRPTAKNWGGMDRLRDDAKKSFSGKATVVAPLDVTGHDSQAGYVILDEQWGAKGEFWKFDESVKQFFKK